MSDGVELFTHESSVSQSAASLFRLQVLQQFDWVLRSWRVLNVSSNVVKDKNVFMSHSWSLFFLLAPLWSRNANVKDLDTYVEIKSLLDKDKSDAGKEICRCFSVFLDRLELTKIDTKGKYDRSVVQKSNKFHGLS